MRWTGMNEHAVRLRMKWPSRSPPFLRSTRLAVCEANASWCVYNSAVIKLIYDEKTRDGVADNFITSMGDSDGESL